MYYNAYEFIIILWFDQILIKLFSFDQYYVNNDSGQYYTIPTIVVAGYSHKTSL